VHFSGTDFDEGKITPFAGGMDVDANYQRIVLEAEAILVEKIRPVQP
jgi:hypothetical protein